MEGVGGGGEGSKIRPKRVCTTNLLTSPTSKQCMGVKECSL